MQDSLVAHTRFCKSFSSFNPPLVIVAISGLKILICAIMYMIYTSNVLLNDDIYISHPGADPGFPIGGGANPLGGVPTYDFAKFCEKLHEIGKILGRRGARTGCAPQIRHWHLFPKTDTEQTQKQLSSQHTPVAMADPRGAPRRMSPHSPKFSQFHAVFRKIWQNDMLAPPHHGWHPLLRESWIRP